MADLAKIRVRERTFNPISPATGEKLSLAITMMGPDDPRMTAFKQRMQQRHLARNQKGKVPKVEELNNEQLEILHKAITKWEWNDDDLDGEKPEFNLALLKRLKAEQSWLITQCDEEFGETQSFFAMGEND